MKIRRQAWEYAKAIASVTVPSMAVANNGDNLHSNKRMRPDQNARYARIFLADSRRYDTAWKLTNSMEEIAEGYFRLVIGAIRWLVINLVLHIFCFNLGRFALLILTAGRYPRLQALERDANKITTFGVVIIILAWVAIYVHNVYM